MSSSEQALPQHYSPASRPMIDAPSSSLKSPEPAHLLRLVKALELQRHEKPKRKILKTQRDDLCHQNLPNVETFDLEPHQSFVRSKTLLPDNLERSENSNPDGEQTNAGDPPSDIPCNTCFVCFAQGGREYAIKIDVAWPHRPEGRSFGEEVNVEQGTPTEVMQAMQDALYGHIGPWKRWLWCYEMKIAEEINFYFDDVALRNVAPIVVDRLDPKAIGDKAKAILDDEPSFADYEMGAACIGEPCHTETCFARQDHLGEDCIQDVLNKARVRLRGLRMRHWLLECLQRPEKAQHRRFLENGLLQDGFVYTSAEHAVSFPTDADRLDRDGGMKVRGVHVTFGWNLNRMLRNLWMGGTFTLFGLAVAWLACILWARRMGDWSTAFALGQLIAASVALILQHT